MTFRFQPRVEPLAGTLRELPLVELAHRLGPGPLVLLDGWPRGTGVLAFAPLPARPPRSFAGLRALLARLEPGRGDPVPGAFHGGFLGALAYELGARAGLGLALPADPWKLPALIGGLFCDFIVRDVRGATHLVLGEDPGDARASVSARARALRARLDEAGEARPCLPAGPLRRLVSSREHGRRVRAARALIAEGEIYQANLSLRFERAVTGDPLELYARLAALHPAPHAAFLRFGRAALLSASPELLLDFGVDAGGPLARTRPIKGTIARGRTAAVDRRRRAALLASEKDRSELAMIVDLERNDLGRTARAGSVRVEGFPRLESYASVHHLVADVVARPRPGIDALACLAALYPGGSVTGAPKLRSMEAIAALEGEGRGFSYGSAVSLDTRGELVASLLIRTLIWRPRVARRTGAGEVTFRVGGGITWGSEPAAEEAEAEAKGLLLARALEGAGRAPQWQRGG
jgi:para-aminobenzoate synthetase component 1